MKIRNLALLFFLVTLGACKTFTPAATQASIDTVAAEGCAGVAVSAHVLTPLNDHGALTKGEQTMLLAALDVTDKVCKASAPPSAADVATTAFRAATAAMKTLAGAHQ